MYVLCRRPKGKKGKKGKGKQKCVRVSTKQVYQVRVGKKTKTFKSKKALIKSL